MVVWAYIAIVSLTWVLVAMNVRWVLRQYAKDRVPSRLYAHLGTLFILGSLIIVITHNVVDRVLDSEEQLRDLHAGQTAALKRLTNE